jgi:hypothetical protein
MILDMTAHDLEPDLVLTVADSAGVADLNQVVSWRVLGTMLGTLVVDAVPDSVVVAADGHSAVLTYNWRAGDTALPGSMSVCAEAVWPGGRPQTFPAAGSVTVRFSPDAG